MSIILGVDPGFADTGWGVIEVHGSKINCLGYGSIKTSAKLELSARLALIYQELNEILKKFKPQLAAVEKLFFYTNVTTAIAVGQARGVILLSIEQQKIVLAEFTPLQVKQAVASYGKATKSQVQKMVKLILNLKETPQPDDAADGLALAIAAINVCPKN